MATPEVPSPSGLDLARPEVKAFIDGVAERNSIKRSDVAHLLAHAIYQQKIIDRVSQPAEHVLEWWEYRERFLTEKRITDGVNFWLEHREPLERIAAEKGVAPEYIVGILGCETAYGTIVGRDRVLDALATLAFDYPPRADFFRKELEQFILLVREEKIDPLTVLGSYTGAMGAAQFMPSNYRKYAVDADGDGHRDLWKSWDDAIASIANYLREYGWETGAPVIAAARLAPDPSFQFDPTNLELNETLESLNANGVQVDVPALASTPVLLISAEQQDGPSYRVGFKNFQVITRYNRSARYAMAVNDLAEAIAARVYVK